MTVGPWNRVVLQSRAAGISSASALNPIDGFEAAST